MFKPLACWSRSLRVLLSASMLVGVTPPLAAQEPSSPGIMHRVASTNERIEMTVNTSRLLTLDQNIPRAQVNNRDILELTPLSPNEIQVFAKKAGVTQINVWNDKKQIHTIDVVVTGDVRELALLLKKEFPHSALRVVPTPNSVILTGFVDRADQVAQILLIAKDFYPNVIDNISVGGVQQIQLRTKVIEVSRTRLRAMGSDFAAGNGSDFFVSSVSGLIDAASASAGSPVGTGADTVRLGFVDGNRTFFTFLEFLKKNELMKIIAEPNLTTVSGRPAFVQAGGEFPILVPQSLGTVSIEYKQYGTRVDFVPIVLGNGNIRLEVRPQVSEIDNTRSVVINGALVPGLKTRTVDTGVEMKPGQTLALAGLVQERVEASNQGLPYLMDVPVVGAAFRRKRETVQEVELLVLVTPELAEAMDPCDVPPCGPGMGTTSPNDREFYSRGYIEKPSCGPCGTGWCPLPPDGQKSHVGQQGGYAPGPGPGPGYDAAVAPSFEELPPAPSTRPAPMSTDGARRGVNRPAVRVVPASTPLPQAVAPSAAASNQRPSATATNPGIDRNMNRNGAPRGAASGNYEAALPPSPSRGGSPAARYNQPKTQELRPALAPNAKDQGPSFIGPVGYDVIK